MRLMGIDYGTKRVGIALSDEGGNMAFPHIVLDNDKDLLKNIEEIVKERKVEEIVIGHSIGLDGKPNIIQADIEELITDITLHIGIPVHLQPEQFSTQEAMIEQGRNKQTDASAAAIILNTFITKKK